MKSYLGGCTTFNSPFLIANVMAEIVEKTSASSRWLGLLCFVAFETAAYFLLAYLTSGLGEADQYQPENTIERNWVKTMTFLVLHLILIVVAVLMLSNQLPRRYRGQVMGWFYLALLTGFGLLVPLFW